MPIPNLSSPIHRIISHLPWTYLQTTQSQPQSLFLRLPLRIVFQRRMHMGKKKSSCLPPMYIYPFYPHFSLLVFRRRRRSMDSFGLAEFTLPFLFYFVYLSFHGLFFFSYLLIHLSLLSTPVTYHFLE